MYEKINELEKKVKNLEEIINLKIKDKKDIILFEKSIIIKNDYERKMLENFIKENDKTKMKFFLIYYLKPVLMGMKPKIFIKNVIIWVQH